MAGHRGCFTRRNRLAKASEFQRVFDQAQRSGSSAFTVLARANEGGAARLGLVISTRCARRAVDRNRLKRLIRESFRQHQTRLMGLDIVVIGKSPAVGQSNPQLWVKLEEHWKKLEQWARS